MPGGRPKLEVWKRFDEMAPDGSVQCLRCGDVISNPKVAKLHNHFTRCNGGWTRAEEKARKKDRLNGVQVVLEGADGQQSQSVHVTQAQLSKCVADLFAPTRKDVADDLLDVAFVERFKAMVDELMEEPFVDVSLSNPKREKLINVMIVYPNRKPVYWTLITTGAESQTVEYMAKLMGGVVDDIDEVLGQGKVTTVTTNNAGNMEKSWRILERKRGLLWNGCSGRTLNLLLQDVGKFEVVRRVISMAEGLATYILKMDLLLARFQEEKTIMTQLGGTPYPRTFTLPVETR
ncbi:hypothetical protein PHMEG_0009065 [Phytophthora megakarya]|uniref:DUF659 domain-containing protein n=1 Tax=Phytophthora megakarya TaxID=4795 RepID=A0A225WIH3_9STRA|nr:hypothetical protein PHMEG_0009065 [Phytophthora megakarya]